MKELISKKKLREFGFLIGIGFPILIGWIIPAITGHGVRLWAFWIGLIGLILGILTPRLLYYPYKFWMFIGHILGWINSRIILGIIFVVILQPIALIMFILGYDPLKKKKTKQNTYRENSQNRKFDFTRIF